MPVVENLQGRIISEAVDLIGSISFSTFQSALSGIRADCDAWAL